MYCYLHCGAMIWTLSIQCNTMDLCTSLALCVMNTLVEQWTQPQVYHYHYKVILTGVQHDTPYKHTHTQARRVYHITCIVVLDIPLSNRYVTSRDRECYCDLMSQSVTMTLVMVTCTSSTLYIVYSIIVQCTVYSFYLDNTELYSHEISLFSNLIYIYLSQRVPAGKPLTLTLVCLCR